MRMDIVQKSPSVKISGSMISHDVKDLTFDFLEAVSSQLHNLGFISSFAVNKHPFTSMQDKSGVWSMVRQDLCQES
jgi:hypothetical protein